MDNFWGISPENKHIYRIVCWQSQRHTILELHHHYHRHHNFNHQVLSKPRRLPWASINLEVDLRLCRGSTYSPSSYHCIAQVQDKMCFIPVLFQKLEVKEPLRGPSSSWRPFGPLDFVLCALWALRPCDPGKVDMCDECMYNASVYEASYLLQTNGQADSGSGVWFATPYTFHNVSAKKSTQIFFTIQYSSSP